MPVLFHVFRSHRCLTMILTVFRCQGCKWWREDTIKNGYGLDLNGVIRIFLQVVDISEQGIPFVELLDATSSPTMHDGIRAEFFGDREVPARVISLTCFPVEHAISAQNAIYEIWRNGFKFDTQTSRTGVEHLNMIRRCVRC